MPLDIKIRSEGVKKMKDIQVCIGSVCHLKGSYDIINRLNGLIADNGLNDKYKVKATFCLGNCVGAVCVKFNDKIYTVLPETAEQFFNEHVKGVVA